MCIGLHIKYSLFLSDFDENLNFLHSFFFKNTQISNFMKIRLLEAELFYVDERTYRHDES